MADRLYIPNELSREELLFTHYFDRLMSEFSLNYEIFVRNEDFQRHIGAGVVKRGISTPSVAAIIWFKYSSYLINNPLNQEVIDAVRNNLAFDIDSEFNRPTMSINVIDRHTFRQLPIEERHRILAEQAEAMKEYYQQDPECQEWVDFDNGEIYEYQP